MKSAELHSEILFQNLTNSRQYFEAPPPPKCDTENIFSESQIVGKRLFIFKTVQDSLKTQSVLWSRLPL